jgi:hypothetical protein
MFDERKREEDLRRKDDEITAEKGRMLKTIGTLTFEHDYLRQSCDKLDIDPEPQGHNR